MDHHRGGHRLGRRRLEPSGAPAARGASPRSSPRPRPPARKVLHARVLYGVGSSAHDADPHAHVVRVEHLHAAHHATQLSLWDLGAGVAAHEHVGGEVVHLSVEGPSSETSITSELGRLRRRARAMASRYILGSKCNQHSHHNRLIFSCGKPIRDRPRVRSTTDSLSVVYAL